MKIFTGKVLHTKSGNTATVQVEQFVAHPLYKKRIKRIKKFQVHDLLGAQVGQTVRFKHSRPYSKLKHFILTEIVVKKEDVVSKKTSKVQPAKVVKKGSRKTK